MKKLTLRGLALQLQAQGQLILELRERFAMQQEVLDLRSRLEIANKRSVLMADADAPVRDTREERSRYDEAVAQLGPRVREPTLREVAADLSVQIASLRDEVRGGGWDPWPAREEYETDVSVQHDTAAASCHLVADVLERRGGVSPEHIANLRYAARHLRQQDDEL